MVTGLVDVTFVLLDGSRSQEGEQCLEILLHLSQGSIQSLVTLWRASLDPHGSLRLGEDYPWTCTTLIDPARLNRDSDWLLRQVGPFGVGDSTGNGLLDSTETSGSTGTMIGEFDCLGFL